MARAERRTSSAYHIRGLSRFPVSGTKRQLSRFARLLTLERVFHPIAFAIWLVSITGALVENDLFMLLLRLYRQVNAIISIGKVFCQTSPNHISPHFTSFVLR